MSIIKDIKEIKSLQKKPDGFFTTFFSRPVSHIFAYIAYRLKITANGVSILSFVACLGSFVVLLFANSRIDYIYAGLLWWFGAILDSADGDLARFSKKMSPFGGWLDSFLDRIKEFLIFGLVGYLAYKQFQNEIYLLLALLSIFSTVMSGYISDTKKLFVTKRTLEVQISKNFSFQMVDTRDFFVTVAIMSLRFRELLWLYSTLFIAAVIVQFMLFYKKYSKVAQK